MQIKLKDSDKRKIHRINEKNKWAISTTELLELVEKHRTGNDYDRALIEYRLRDCNFHYEVGLLTQGKYAELNKNNNYENI